MAKDRKGRDQKLGYGDRRLLYDSEGLLDYCQAVCPFEDPKDLRRVGWNLGRQIICQHVVELAIKSELAKHQRAVPKHHDLECLFGALPRRRRKKAEDLYQQLLRVRVQWTWDVFRTVKSFLKFLGQSPTVETRYYFEEGARSNRLGVDYFSNLIAPDSYVPLIYALMIGFHRYPTGPLVPNYETEFRSLKESVLADHDEQGRNIRHRPIGGKMGPDV